jgi:Family of unknown function (DUF6502)
MAPDMNAATQTQPVLEAAAGRVLRSLARVLLRYGVSVQAFIDLAKRAYIGAAQCDFTLPTRKMTGSRLALVTGLTRKDVQRLNADRAPSDERTLARVNRAVRVIAGWRRDPDFHGEAGVPAVLRLDGEAPSFAELVRRYSGDIPVRAVLDELLRNGSVTVTDSAVRLSDRGLPSTDESGKLALLGTDVSDLVDTVAFNLQVEPSRRRFQRKVMYDNLSREAVAEFRRIATERSQQVLEEFDRWLARHDRDLTGSTAGTGRVRAGVGMYFFEEEITTTEAGGKT